MPLANPPTVFELFGHHDERSVTSLPSWIREDEPTLFFSPRPFPVIEQQPIETRGPALWTPAGDSIPIVDLTTIFGPLFPPPSEASPPDWSDILGPLFPPPSEGPPAEPPPSIFELLGFFDLFGWG